MFSLFRCKIFIPLLMFFGKISGDNRSVVEIRIWFVCKQLLWLGVLVIMKTIKKYRVYLCISLLLLV